jgi:hypothetical protein
MTSDPAYEYKGGKGQGVEEEEARDPNPVNKKMLTAEEKMVLETTKNQAKKLGMSVNEVIAYRRFQRAFNEIKVYREDHYKCVTELKALKHKMK